MHFSGLLKIRFCSTACLPCKSLHHGHIPALNSFLPISSPKYMCLHSRNTQYKLDFSFYLVCDSVIMEKGSQDKRAYLYYLEQWQLSYYSPYRFIFNYMTSFLAKHVKTKRNTTKQTVSLLCFIKYDKVLIQQIGMELG